MNQEAIEAAAVARIRNISKSNLFHVGEVYYLEAGILNKLPKELEVKKQIVSLPSSAEVVIDIVVSAEDMEIKPRWVQQFTFQQEEEHELVEFQLIPKMEGYKEIQVGFFYQRHWLAQVKFDVGVVASEERVSG